MIKVLNFTGIAIILLAVFTIINDLNFTFCIAAAIFGVLLTIPDSLLFSRTIKSKNPRFSAYWMVKLIGYMFALFMLTIIFILQVKNK